MLTKGGGGVKKVQKYADIICEWPLSQNHLINASEINICKTNKKIFGTIYLAPGEKKA